jgi:outer membrane protein TolC
MARRIALLFVWCVLVWPSAAAAQSPVTLPEAIEAAIGHNPGLQAARAQVDQAAAEVSVTRGGWFPRLTLTESWQRSDQPVFAFGSLLAARQFTAADFAVARLNAPGATNLFTTRVGVGQIVFDGGRTSGAVAAAAAQRDVAQADADRAAFDVVRAVTRTYGQVIALQAAAKATDAAVESATEDLARATRRRDAGTATDADVLAMSVHLADMRQRRLQTAADLASARANLNRLMGAPIETEVLVVEDLPSPPPSGDLESLYVEAASARPELRRADAQVRMADASARQARSIWWPQVSAQAGLEWNGTRMGDRASAWVVGGEARWTISLSGADVARARAAASARTAVVAGRDDLRAQVRVDVFTAVRQLEAATARVLVGVSAREDATERARVVRNRYDNGLASMTDVLAAASATLDADARRIAAVVDALNAHADLERALGRAPRK